MSWKILLHTIFEIVPFCCHTFLLVVIHCRPFLATSVSVAMLASFISSANWELCLFKKLSFLGVGNNWQGLGQESVEVVDACQYHFGQILLCEKRLMS
jgi:hypothetical protein